MREIRTSGSEGGAAQVNAPSLPLSGEYRPLSTFLSSNTFWTPFPFPHSRETPVLHSVSWVLQVSWTSPPVRFVRCVCFCPPFWTPCTLILDPTFLFPHPRAFPILDPAIAGDTAEQNRFPLPYYSPVTSHILSFWTLRHLILDTCFASFKLPIPDRGRDGALTCAAPPSEPDVRISRIRLSSQ